MSMSQGMALTELEYRLLSRQMDDDEPLFILYADITRDFEGITLDSVLQTLVKLVQLGFSKCLVSSYVNESREPRETVTIEELRRHCEGRSEEDLRQHPDPEYYFEATKLGRSEALREIYARYYPVK